LKNEDSEVEISSSDKFGISVLHIQQSDTSNSHIQGVPGGMCQTSGGCSL